MADAAAERESADARGRHEPAGHGEAERLGLVVDVGPGAAALGGDRAGDRVDRHAAHRRQVDHDTAVGGREAGKRV